MIKTLLFLGVCIAAAVCAQVFLKLGLNQIGLIEPFTLRSIRALAGNLHVVTAAGCYLLAAGAWVLALSRAELNFAYPILTLSIPGVAWASTLFLGEPLPATRIVGTVLTVLGVWLVLRSP